MPLLSHFVPKEFAGLLKYISPAAFEVVEWKSVLKQAPLLTKRIVSYQGTQELAQEISSTLPPHLQITIAPKQPVTDEKRFGEAILHLYFLQLTKSEGQFLDLRRARFTQDDEIFLWQPSGLWVQFDESFRKGLLKIYSGYYRSEDDLMDQGLSQLGLITDSISDQQKNEIKSILLEHIGGDSESMKFDLNRFQDSFDRLFKYLKKNRIKLSSDFLYLGVYLATLYLNLGSINESFNVKEAFLKSQSTAAKD